MKKNKILVTGGAGFIGSHLIDKLLDEDYKVCCIDSFDSFYDVNEKRDNVNTHLNYKNYQLHEGNIENKAFIIDVFSKFKPDIVVHLAAKAGVRPSVENPFSYEQTNIVGTLNILEVCVKYKVKKFVNGSSSSVYGLNESIPFKESDPLNLIASPYAATKLASEAFCHTFHNIYKLPIINLRFFTVYGPRQRPDLAIRKFMTKILNNEPIEIYGDGSTSRDYTYVEDIVFGVIKAINYYEKEYDTFNLGNSTPIKLIDLVRKIEIALNKKAKLEYKPIQKGDVPVTYADISKSENRLGYSPKTNLDQGLKNMADWIKDTKHIS
jgi:UDP-glucuronate 4-epimerase